MSVEVFSEGDFVRFKGLIVGQVRLAPRTGKLKFAKKVTVQNAVTIEGDEQKLIFNPDGSMYCHSQHGILLEHMRDTPINQGGK